MTDRIDLTGAVDLHTHVGPSPFGRRVDGYESAVEAGSAGMDAIVMKEHFLPTAYARPYVDRLLDRDGIDVEAIGSTVLNYCNGGFNPFAVQAAIDYGAEVIWGPTIDAAHHAEQTGELGTFLGVEAREEYADVEGIRALDEAGELRDDVRLCVEKIAANDVVLALGHLSFPETRAVVEYASELGHEKVVVDHPNYHVTDLRLDQQRELVSLGAVLNFPFMAISPKYHWIESDDLAENIRQIGVDNCVLSSDVGQRVNPSVPESLRILGETLRSEGLSTDEIEQMIERTPKELLY
jgi:hypothetical protein